MFCSTIIPTIGRATLTKAVSSLLDQSFAADDFEVIVVNDTGIRLRPAGWMDSPTVRMLETNRRERSVARNTGAAIARGEYLHFLDDDDWMLPDALATFRSLARSSDSAAVLYGGVRFVDAAANSLGEIGLGRSGNCYTQLVAGSLIPPLGLLVRADAFSAVGGFDPRFAASEEVDLWRRLALHYDFAHISQIVACALRGDGWQTSSVNADAVDNNRVSRDATLGESGAFARLRASADSAYWRGRMVHAYLVAAWWNLKNRRPWTATSRMVYGLASTLTAARSLAQPDFWRALQDDHVPCTQARILGDQW